MEVCIYKYRGVIFFFSFRCLGFRWDLIAGRIPGRTPEELERYWIMRHCDTFADKRNQQTKDNSKKCWSSNV